MISTISYYFNKYIAITCCSLACLTGIIALGLIALNLEDWTIYLTIPVLILFIYLFIDLLNDELNLINDQDEKDFEDSLLHDQDPRERL